MQESKRVRRALTADVERRALVAMAHRLPGWISSDHLTVIGVIGALGAAVGYALSVLDVDWLWLASGMLVVNWYGDSLDGTLARVRHAQRPRYGYYLDHAVDAFTTVIVGAGIGLSPFVSLYAGLGIVILYLLMSINVYLESAVYDEFKMDYGLIGPTEVRILLVGLNTVAIWLTSNGRITPEDVEPGANVFVGVGLGVMALMLLWRFGRNLRRLAFEDPLKHP